MADERFAVPGDMPDFVREAEEMVSSDEVLPRVDGSSNYQVR